MEYNEEVLRRLNINEGTMLPVCRICKEIFICRDVLHYHNNVVHNSNLYKCLLCIDVKLTDLYSKYEHYMTYHGIEINLSTLNIEGWGNHVKACNETSCLRANKPLEYLNLMY